MRNKNRLLGQLTKRYLSVLRLGPPNWDKIQVQFGSTEDIGPGILGCCSWFLEDKTAEIFILDPDDPDAVYIYAAQDSTPEEVVEVTLVHEMLHLLLEGGTGKVRSYNAHYEYGLTLLAKLIVELYGQKVSKQRRSRTNKKA